VQRTDVFESKEAVMRNFGKLPTRYSLLGIQAFHD